MGPDHPGTLAGASDHARRQVDAEHRPVPNESGDKWQLLPRTTTGDVDRTRWKTGRVSTQCAESSVRPRCKSGHQVAVIAVGHISPTLRNQYRRASRVTPRKKNFPLKVFVGPPARIRHCGGRAKPAKLVGRLRREPVTASGNCETRSHVANVRMCRRCVTRDTRVAEHGQRLQARHKAVQESLHLCCIGGTTARPVPRWDLRQGHLHLPTEVITTSVSGTTKFETHRPIRVANGWQDVRPDVTGHTNDTRHASEPERVILGEGKLHSLCGVEGDIELERCANTRQERTGVAEGASSHQDSPSIHCHTAGKPKLEATRWQPLHFLHLLLDARASAVLRRLDLCTHQLPRVDVSTVFRLHDAVASSRETQIRKPLLQRLLVQSLESNALRLGVHDSLR
mmetsp:Transcript_9323/g.26017  ORF Transcript_9323/g.26017 Transcript_9323/m.26017 type:complete len:397 (+) Transcript_9323:484-1674(+)